MNSGIAKRFTVREATVEDAGGVGELSLAVGEDPEITTVEQYVAWWRWLHRDSPPRLTYAIVGVDGEERVIGHLGLSAFRFSIGTEQCVAGFPCQLIVAEDYRQELLFPLMEKRLLRSYPDFGFDFAYSLINRPDVLRAHKALGFSEMGRIPLYVRPYRVVPALSGRFPESPFVNLLGKMLAPVVDRVLRLSRTRRAGLQAERIHRFDDRVDRLFDRVRAHFPVSARRDHETLNWRFSDVPGRTYEIWGLYAEMGMEGYIALRQMMMKGFNTLFVADFLCLPGQSRVASALLHLAHQAALERGVDLIACVAAPHSPYLPLLRSNGYFPTSEGYSLIVHYPSDESWKDSACQRFENWHVSLFDHDYI